MNLTTTLLATKAGGTQGIISMVVIYAAIIALVSTLAVGDSILTTSGFFGVVIDIMDEVVIVEFGNNKNCRIPMKKENIVEIDKQEEEAKAAKK